MFNLIFNNIFFYKMCEIKARNTLSYRKNELNVNKSLILYAFDKIFNKIIIIVFKFLTLHSILWLKLKIKLVV